MLAGRVRAAGGRTFASRHWDIPATLSFRAGHRCCLLAAALAAKDQLVGGISIFLNKRRLDRNNQKGQRTRAASPSYGELAVKFTGVQSICSLKLTL